MAPRDHPVKAQGDGQPRFVEARRLEQQFHAPGTQEAGLPADGLAVAGGEDGQADRGRQGRDHRTGHGLVVGSSLTPHRLRAASASRATAPTATCSSALKDTSSTPAAPAVAGARLAAIATDGSADPGSVNAMSLNVANGGLSFRERPGVLTPLVAAKAGALRWWVLVGGEGIASLPKGIGDATGRARV